MPTAIRSSHFSTGRASPPTAFRTATRMRGSYGCAMRRSSTRLRSTIASISTSSGRESLQSRTDMATWDDVRRMALELPETTEGTSFGNVAWKVKDKVFAWERPLRKSDLAALGKAAPGGAILGVRTDGLEMKQVLLDSAPGIFF